MSQQSPVVWAPTPYAPTLPPAANNPDFIFQGRTKGDVMSLEATAANAAGRLLTLYDQNGTIVFSVPANGGPITAPPFAAPFNVSGDGSLVGSGGAPNDLSASAFTASTSLTNSNKPFTGALNGYTAYFGQPGASQGTMQGGSAAVRVDVNGSTGAIAPAALAWECLVQVVGNTANTMTGTAYALQTTAYAQDTAKVTNLVGFHSRAPFNNGGTPTVTNAYGLLAEEPLVGTNRWTYFGVGRHTFDKGTHARVIEMHNAGNTLQWATDAVTWTGFASDGTSTRISLEPNDAASGGRLLLRGGGSIAGPNLILDTGNGQDALSISNNGGAKLAGVSFNGGWQLGNSSGVSPGQLWGGSGVPAAGLGANGDYYFRTDTPGTVTQRIYVKSAGSWVATAA